MCQPITVLLRQELGRKEGKTRDWDGGAGRGPLGERAVCLAGLQLSVMHTWRVGVWRREERGKGRGLLCRCILPKKSLSTSIKVPCLQATPIMTTNPLTCFLLIPYTTHQRPIPKDLASRTPKFSVKNKAGSCLISSPHLVRLLKPAKMLLPRRSPWPCFISRPASPLWRAVPVEPGRDRVPAHLWAQPMQAQHIHLDPGHWESTRVGNPAQD